MPELRPRGQQNESSESQKETLEKHSDLSESQRKCQKTFCGPMALRGRALQHNAASLLLSHAKQGCPTDCGPDWTREMTEAAVKQGAHASAKDPKAAKCLQKEAFEKAKQGKCFIAK